MNYAFESLGPVLRYVVLAFMLVFALVGLLVIVLAAALPGQIANRVNHPQAKAINVCGWLGLPTGIGWVIAMVWAFTRRPTACVPENSTEATAMKAQLQRMEKAIDLLEKRLEAQK